MEHTFKDNLLSLSKLLNFFLALGFLAMTVLSLILGISLAYTSSEKSRTLIPPVISKAFTVSDGAVDAPYLQMMGEYFLKLKLNVTPATVTRQYGLLLDYIPTENWSTVQPTLVKDAERVQKDNISSRFDARPNHTHISLESMQFKQTGTLTKTVGERTLPPEEVTYIVQMAYRDGLLTLIGIKKEGSKT
ncbi:MULTISPECIES: type IV conjugative transfer system protein TraE [Vibrio]|uniref:Type IV conjugative transfer system protein TraE n=2 Tax=Vibrio TaxID=662 RepID=A0A3G4VMZ3_9VIBR|nr:type IV conjugative transfer system protein TraE [Vibrio mediterranei]AYV25002.1 type IV conjugative transfer system protein TraE [Vibrio mediterranei]MCG9790785.1 type IV conjugative transfer system protein TraE [Vibrio mediterranei]